MNYAPALGLCATQCASVYLDCGELGSSPFQRWLHRVCGKARHKQSLYAAKKLTDCGTDFCSGGWEHTYSLPRRSSVPICVHLWIRIVARRSLTQAPFRLRDSRCQILISPAQSSRERLRFKMIGRVPTAFFFGGGQPW